MEKWPWNSKGQQGRISGGRKIILPPATTLEQSSSCHCHRAKIQFSIYNGPGTIPSLLRNDFIFETTQRKFFYYQHFKGKEVKVCPRAHK